MSTYKSKPYLVNATQEQVYTKLANPEALNEKIKNLPFELQQKLHGVNFTADAISFSVPPMGEMKMLFTERTAPSRIVISPEASPVPFNLALNIEPTENNRASIYAELDIELNMFLRQMVGNKLEEGVEKMAEMLSRLPYGD